MKSELTVNLEKISRISNVGIPILAIGFFSLGAQVSFYFHFLTVTFLLATLLNFFYRHIQKSSTLLSNFGLMAQMRYMIESIGPEFRQYLYLNDTEERPFTRVERNEVYQKSKNEDSSEAFGSQLNFDQTEIKLRHSMFPADKSTIQPFQLVFGEERKLKNAYAIYKPIMISAMSYGALGERAVRSLARGAKKAGIPMNTGEGGFPKYHLMENCDLIFQLGTAKFGVRNEDGRLAPDKLREIAKLPQIKMIEIKLSQGAKPGKGGLLPKEKITAEIAELRGVPMDQDVISPPRHVECVDINTTLDFIKQVQDISELPVGIKMCLGREDEFKSFVQSMKARDIFPDYIDIDGAEGGTGAAPKSFMDDIGLPIFQALPIVQNVLLQEGVRERLKLICSGKLINPGKQFVAMSFGADACYSARGFLLALGCIQSLHCNNNTCPAGITTHVKSLQSGLDIEQKSERVRNFVHNLEHDQYEILASLGKTSFAGLDMNNLFLPQAATNQSREAV